MSLSGLAKSQNQGSFGKQSWNIVYRSRRSGQNKSQTTTKLLVAEYGLSNFRLHPDL
jgi:hypothetical protein